MKRIILFLTVALISIGSFTWWYYQPERVVKRRVLSLVSQLQITSDMGRASRLMKGNRITGYFAPQVKLVTPFDEANGTIQRSELTSGFSFAAEHASTIAITPEDDMQVSISDNHADVTFHSKAVVTVGKWIKPVNGRYHITMRWVKTSDDWQLTRSDWSKAP